MKSAVIALLLFVPASSIGVTAALFLAPGAIGNGIFTLVKIWLVVLPLFWTWKTNPEVLRLPRLKKQQILVGIAWGLLMFAAIIAAYWFLGRQSINLTAIRRKAVEVGITNLNIYLAGFFYWSFINSFIEECIWRGFVYSQCAVLMNSLVAVIFSALFFTLHHSIALYGYTHNWLIVGVGSLGVFLAGVIWSFCYQTSGSIVPGYISHILADLAIALIGWQLLFPV
ncbi:MAG: CPBP family intramembrane glutamic endopeptidase [Pleurocapsa sp.]